MAQAPPGTSNAIGPNLGNAQPANPFLFLDQQYVTGANLSWNKGRHAFRGGVETTPRSTTSNPRVELSSSLGAPLSSMDT